MRLFDAHCHLQDERLVTRAAAVFEAAGREGVAGFCCCGTEEGDWGAVADLAAAHPGIVPAYGLHPWYISPRSPDWSAALAARLAANPRAAVGEIGLDHAIADHDDADQHLRTDRRGRGRAVDSGGHTPAVRHPVNRTAAAAHQHDRCIRSVRCMEMAPVGQTRRHLPHRMHWSLSIQIYVLSAARLASTTASTAPSAPRKTRDTRLMHLRGATSMHQSQWMHLSWSISNL